MLPRYLNMYNTVLFLGSFSLGSAETVVKQLKLEKERVRIGCPHGYVIYHPSVYAIARNTSTIGKASMNCKAIPRRLEKRLEKCYLKKNCDLILQKGDTITCGNEIDDSQRHITHIVFEKMYCAPREIVMNICNIGKIDRSTLRASGIIRSHKHYPRDTLRSRRLCEALIPLDTKSSIILSIVEDRTANMLSIHTVSRNNQSECRLDKTSMERTLTIHGNTTEAIKIKADFRWRRRHFKGFLMSYSVHQTKTLETYYKWPKASRPVLRQLGWIFQVRPVIEQCAAESKGEMQLTCKPDEVIYFPAMSVSGHTRRRSKCSFGKYKCGGLTLDLLVQENDCFWKRTCSIKWKGQERIIMSRENKCIGLMASMLGTSGHRCVHHENIFDICTQNATIIDSPWGIIRSHSNYPWFIGPACDEYERKIKIGRKQAVAIAIQDMDLDPDGRDEFRIYHVRKQGQRMKQIVGSKAREGLAVQAKDGELIVKLKRHKRSNDGRGFVLVFHRFAVTSKPLQGYVKDPGPGRKGIVSDAASSEITGLSNWRLCSAKGRFRKQGRGCHKRVWTDYYKRLG